MADSSAASLDGRRSRYSVMGAEGEADMSTVFEYHESDGSWESKPGTGTSSAEEIR